MQAASGSSVKSNSALIKKWLTSARILCDELELYILRTLIHGGG
jgi:hypothetical protein